MKAPKIGKVKYAGGSSTGGFLTNDNTLRLEGKCTPGAKITIFDNGKKIGTAKVDKKGKWAFDSKALTDGAQSFTAKAKLGADKSPASKALAGTIDAKPPPAPQRPDLAAASDSGTSNSDNVTSDNTPTLTGIAEAGATVTIRDGATVLGTVVAHATTGAWSFTTAALSNGAHSLTATATDKVGNTGPASAALVVTVDKVAPPALSAPNLATTSDSGSSSTDNITNDTTPTLTGTAEAGATVTIKDGATVLGTVTAHATTGAWSFTTGVLSNGAHSLTATATDKAGNTGPASAGLVVTVDTAAPVAPSAPDLANASDSGSSQTDNFTNDDTPTLTGTAEPGATVTIKDGATVLGTVTAHATTGEWSFTAGVLSNAAHSLLATATDAAGNTGPASATLVVTVDTSTPAPSVPDLDAASDSGTSSGDDLTNNTTPTFTGTAEPGATVTLKEGATVLGTGIADTSGNWSITSAELAEGHHSLTATATDQAGNTGPASATLVVTVDMAAPGAAVIAGYDEDTGGVGDRVTLDDTLVIAGTAEAGATVEIFDGLASIGSATANGSGAWSFATATLISGHHSFTAQQTDAAGNTGAASAALAVRVGYDIDVATMTAEVGFRIFGADADDFAGRSVSSAGDINGDGFDDLIVGAYGGDGATDGTPYAGEAIVVFGKATGFADVDVSAPDFVSSGTGFRIFGADEGDQAGRSVSSAGDINGDGFGDLIVGADRGTGAVGGTPYAGEAIVVFGGATGFADIDLAAPLSPTNGFRIFGDDAYDQAGLSVSSAGDINGDGFDDLIVGAYGDGATGGTPYAGEAIVIFGKATGFADVDLATLAPADGFRIFGDDAYDQAGLSVSSAGDINGDGFDDLIVGAFGGDGAAGSKSSAGEAIVVFGKATGFADVDVSSPTFVSSGTGFRIFGANGGDRAGQSVASAGDVNGDGFDDLIVGASRSGEYDDGEAIVVFGRATGFDDVDVSAPDFV